MIVASKKKLLLENFPVSVYRGAIRRSVNQGPGATFGIFDVEYFGESGPFSHLAPNTEGLFDALDKYINLEKLFS